MRFPFHPPARKAYFIIMYNFIRRSIIILYFFEYAKSTKNDERRNRGLLLNPTRNKNQTRVGASNNYYDNCLLCVVVPIIIIIVYRVCFRPGSATSPASWKNQCPGIINYYYVGNITWLGCQRAHTTHTHTHIASCYLLL